jgi:hypothetical protein
MPEKPFKQRSVFSRQQVSASLSYLLNMQSPFAQRLQIFASSGAQRDLIPDRILRNSPPLKTSRLGNARPWLRFAIIVPRKNTVQKRRNLHLSLLASKIFRMLRQFDSATVP